MTRTEKRLYRCAELIYRYLEAGRVEHFDTHKGEYFRDQYYWRDDPMISKRTTFYKYRAVYAPQRYRQYIDLMDSMFIDKCTLRVRSITDIYQDLLYLYTHYHITITNRSLKNKERSMILSWITEDIIFSSVNLGKFKISISFQRKYIHALYNDAYKLEKPVLKVQALTPVRSCQAHRVTHPHIYDSKICLGYKSEEYLLLFLQGYILDVFEIILSVIRTYSPDSAYKRIETFKENSVQCSECNIQTHKENMYTCSLCNCYVCNTCCQICSVCQAIYCNEHIHQHLDTHMTENII